MNKGFTLIELLISMAILTIITLGFFAWTGTVIQTNLSTKKNNIAHSIATDVIERLKKLPDDSNFIRPKSGNNKCIGYDAVGSLKKCQACGIDSLGADIIQDPSGFTEYTDFWNEVSGILYMYDNNGCENSEWSLCKNGVNINPLANPSIDHPDPLQLTSNPAIYDGISPIRYLENTTYYVVWSVAYTSCLGESSRRKFFVTVYWIDPEPKDTTISSVQTGIASGNYLIKSLSLTTDRTTGTEE